MIKLLLSDPDLAHRLQNLLAGEEGVQVSLGTAPRAVDVSRDYQLMVSKEILQAERAKRERPKHGRPPMKLGIGGRR